MRNSRKNQICVEKIVFYCDEISKILNNHSCDRDKFNQSTEMQYACSMCIIQIGELIAIMDDDFKDRFHEIPWRQIKGARNVYVHQYGEIDLDEIWNTLVYSIPELKSNLHGVMKVMEKDNETLGYRETLISALK